LRTERFPDEVVFPNSDRQEPIRNCVLMDTEEPNVTKFKTETLELNRMKLRIDTVLAQLISDRTEQELPNCKDANSEAVLPNRA
jgi:hypothetical protein